MASDPQGQELEHPEPGARHGTFDPLVHVVGAVRQGWGFTCGCGYRSPLFESEDLAKAAMHEHATSAPAKGRRWPFGKKKWPGWPAERRHDQFG
jgi:hypothetical protein